jgi:geranylgeranyl diphosphate synthase type II
VAGQYHTLYDGYGHSPAQKLHYASSAALLGGDLLLAGAYDMLHTSQLPMKAKLDALDLLRQAVFVVAGGELLDTEAAFVPPTADESLRIAQLKTSHYSFVTTLQMGAVLAGASAEVIHTLGQAGEAIGIAYQLADDLLGMFGNERITGKTTAGDLVEGKRTYLVERGLALTDTNGRKKLQAALGNPKATRKMQQAAKAVLVDSGAKAETEAMMVRKQTEATLLLTNIPLQDEARSSLTALFAKLAWREA